MNVNELQQQIHIIYEGDVDYPDDPSDEDWQIRLELINVAITEWASTPNVLWHELVELYYAPYDDPLTCPTNFDRMYCGEIVCNGKTIKQINIEDSVNYQKGDETCFYVLGNPVDGYTINLLGLELPDRPEIHYLYIKKPTRVSEGEDVSECPDSTYIVHRVVAGLCDQDSDPRANKELTMSQTLLAQMIVRNSSPAYHSDYSYPIE